MILLAGGTGTLGTQVVRLLTDHGLAVRVLTRDPQRARHLESEHVEIMRGDVRDRRAAEGAVAGTETVISAVHGFAGSGGDSPRTVDQAGNSTLITAARAARARHFILVSVQGVAPDHPMELFRMKAAAEHELQTSGLAWTIIRSSAFMETWASLIGEPLLVSGKMRIFGRPTLSTSSRHTMLPALSSWPSQTPRCGVRQLTWVAREPQHAAGRPDLPERNRQDRSGERRAAAVDAPDGDAHVSLIGLERSRPPRRLGLRVPRSGQRFGQARA